MRGSLNTRTWFKAETLQVEQSILGTSPNGTHPAQWIIVCAGQQALPVQLLCQLFQSLQLCLVHFFLLIHIHIAQWIEGLPTKPDDMSSMPRILKEEGEN